MPPAKHRAASAKSGRAPTGSSLEAWIRFAPFLVGAFAVAASIAGISNGFTWDDIPIIRDDLRLHSFGHWAEILTLPYWPPPALPDLYRPVTSLLLSLEWSLGSGAPVVFRVVSYSLYVAASIGVFRLTSFFAGPYIALGAAMLFAAHPVHVEATAVAVNQSELLLCLLTTLAVLRYLQGRIRPAGMTPTDWIVIGILYVLASLSKEQGLLLPVVLLAAEASLPEGPTLRRRLRLSWKGFTILLGLGLCLAQLRRSVLGQVAPPVPSEALRGLGINERVLTLLRVIPEWGRLLIWPAHLRLEYRPQEFIASSHFGAMESLGSLVLIGVSVLAWVFRKKAPVVSFGIALMVITLFPVSNLVVPTFVLIAERTLFLPSVGFFLVLSGLAGYVLTRHPIRGSPFRIMVSALGLLSVAAIGRSVLRHRDWRNVYSVALAGVHDSPRNWHAWSSLGDLLFQSSQRQEAMTAYERAIQLAPESWRVRNDYGMRLRQVGLDGEAVAQFRLSIAENPNQILPLAQLPPALIALGRYQEARRLADSIIAVANAPPVMVWLRHVADSAMISRAPPGSIRIGVGVHP